ncbi:MAG: PD-(D/E)XK nuclease family protein, partial [Actinomycetota bacterium]
DAGVELNDSSRKRAAELACNLTRAPVAPLLAEAAAAGELRREQDFAILVGETIVHGKIDALAHADGAAIVVDYKTGNLSEDYSYEKAAAKYENQMTAYALAASRIYPGLPVRVVLVFLNHPELEHPRQYRPEEIVKLEDSLAGTIASMAGGDFAPLPKLDKHLCYSCPGGPSNARLCPLAG